jgi:2-methylisocitrate lyase-like PEP mutase family enzyme
MTNLKTGRMTETAEQATKYQQFRNLHRAGDPLILVNAWDVASARVVAAAGATAIATTSAGVAWSLGAPDGDSLDRGRAIDLVARIAAAVTLPVSADIESGFGATPDEVAATVAAIRAAGAVGINIEDGVRTIADHAERLRAIDTTSIFVNARIDTYLRGTGDIRDAIDRAHAFIEAGAEGIFVPGVADESTIKTLVGEIPAPLNILVGAGSPSVRALTDLGVARISLGSSVAQAAYAVARRAAVEALGLGTYEAVGNALDYGELNAIMG